MAFWRGCGQGWCLGGSFVPLPAAIAAVFGPPAMSLQQPAAQAPCLTHHHAGWAGWDHSPTCELNPQRVEVTAVTHRQYFGLTWPPPVLRQWATGLGASLVI